MIIRILILIIPRCHYLSGSSLSRTKNSLIWLNWLRVEIPVNWTYHLLDGRKACYLFIYCPNIPWIMIVKISSFVKNCQVSQESVNNFLEMGHKIWRNDRVITPWHNTLRSAERGLRAYKNCDKMAKIAIYSKYHFCFLSYETKRDFLGCIVWELEPLE